MLEISLAAVKINKYAVREGGDTLEMVERPHGGISVVLADGQGSGRAAKSISNMVTSKAITLLKEGARDGAAARATNDYLYAFRHGQVSATLNILSVDVNTRTIVVSRNSHCPVLILEDSRVHWLEEPSAPIGIYAKTKPVISEIEARPGTVVVVFTDGVMHAGRRYGRQIDVGSTATTLAEAHGADVEHLAKGLLETAIELDMGRPADDMSVVVLAVAEAGANFAIRQMVVRLPIAWNT